MADSFTMNISIMMSFNPWIYVSRVLAPFIICYQHYFRDKILIRLFSTLKSYSQMYLNVDDNFGLLGEKQNQTLIFISKMNWREKQYCAIWQQSLSKILLLFSTVLWNILSSISIREKMEHFRDTWTILKEYVTELLIFLCLSSINLGTDGRTLFLDLAFCFKTFKGTYRRTYTSHISWEVLCNFKMVSIKGFIVWNRTLYFWIRIDSNYI